jgi:hypothetical protein
VVLIIFNIIRPYLYFPSEKKNFFPGVFKIRLHNTRYTENIDGHVTLMVIVSGMGGFAERLFGRADIAEVYWEKDESKLDKR